MKTANALAVVNPAMAHARALEHHGKAFLIGVAFILIAPWIELLWLLAHIKTL